MERRLALLLVSASLVGACAAPTAEAPRTVVSPSAPLLVHTAALRPGGLESTLLKPAPLGGIRGPDRFQDVELMMGAMHAFRGHGDERRDNLALIFEATSADAPPLFWEERRLLLEMDGRIFMGPKPSPRLYSIRRRDEGITEIMMVPVTPDVLEQLVEAKQVRARLGPWATLELSKAERGRLSELLASIPPEAAFAPAPKKSKKGLSKTDQPE